MYSKHSYSSPRPYSVQRFSAVPKLVVILLQPSTSGRYSSGISPSPSRLGSLGFRMDFGGMASPSTRSLGNMPFDSFGQERTPERPDPGGPSSRQTSLASVAERDGEERQGGAERSSAECCSAPSPSAGCPPGNEGSPLRAWLPRQASGEAPTIGERNASLSLPPTPQRKGSLGMTRGRLLRQGTSAVPGLIRMHSGGLGGSSEIVGNDTDA
jgi:hypothetical protein